MNSLIKLGATIFGVIIKITSKNDNIINVIDGIFQISEAAEQDFFTRRGINRIGQDISDSIAKSCNQILSHYQICEERAKFFYETVTEVVNKSELTYDLVIAQKASADTMYQHLFVIASKYEKMFDPNEYQVFLRLVRHISEIIVNSVLESPSFVNRSIKHVASIIEELQKKTDEVLQRLEEINRAVSKKTEDFQRYERHYRNNTAEKYGWIHLLGAKSLDREEKRYKLSIAYVALEMREGANPSGNLDIANLFSKSRLIWIDGEAGSGKSTLMQWVARNSASNNGDVLPELKESIPFLIELRKHDPRSLSIKKAVDSVMLDNDCTMPDNWITQNLESGNAIVLVDGFDEVKTEDRDCVLDWIEELSSRYAKIRIVVTSRPQVGKKISKEFARYRLLPMSRDRVDRFLQYWHEAVLVDKLGVDKEEAGQYISKLSVQIDNSEAIRRMVTNPLLCAMICALHYKNGAIMSTERNELYDDCCKMLFGNRDNEKEVQAFAHIQLSYEEKKTILAQLAYWMMKNDLIVAETEHVVTRIGQAISGLRRTGQQYHPKELYQYFLERSGILRSPEEGHVDFIHKSFQEFLAAYEINKQDDWGFIASKAGDVNWHETLLLSMGFSNINDSEFVIERILGDGNNEKNIVIAAACGTNAPRLSPKLRSKINAKIENLIPPKSIDASERLCGAGDFVVPYLQCNDSLTPNERYFSLNTLRMISSTQALVVAGSYMSHSAENREIILIGNMLGAYTRKEVQSVYFEKIVLEYIKSISILGVLNIPEVFLKILWMIPFAEVIECVSKFTDVTITGFKNQINSKFLSFFSGLRSLTLVGDFNSVSSIKDISEQLVSLELCDYGGKFDFYELNTYSLQKLDRFYLYSNKNVYFNGSDCRAINNVSELGLHFYNPLSEIFLDNFKAFVRLKSLSLYHEDAADFRYIDLVNSASLHKLIINVPKYISCEIINLIKSQTSDVPETVIRYDDDPYQFAKLV